MDEIFQRRNYGTATVQIQRTTTQRSTRIWCMQLDSSFPWMMDGAPPRHEEVAKFAGAHQNFLSCLFTGILF